MNDEMVITFPGGKKVYANYMGYEIKTDQPIPAGGEDSAPAPFLLFLASIGTCAGIYILSFCQNRNIPTDDIRLIQTIEPDSTGAIGKIGLTIQVPPSFPAQYSEALVKVASQCAVKKAIQAQPQFDVKTEVK